MVTVGTAGLTWRELDEQYPDLEFREIIDGALVVTPSPGFGHQAVLGRLHVLVAAWAAANGAIALFSPLDLALGPRMLFQPDLLVYRRDQRDHLSTEMPLTLPPALVVEVSSPATRSRDLGVKRDAYAAFGVPEYWFVDIPARCIVRFGRRADGTHGDAEVAEEGDSVASAALTGLTVAVADVLTDVPRD